MRTRHEVGANQHTALQPGCSVSARAGREQQHAPPPPTATRSRPLLHGVLCRWPSCGERGVVPEGRVKEHEPSVHFRPHSSIIVRN